MRVTQRKVMTLFWENTHLSFVIVQGERERERKRRKREREREQANAYRSQE